MAKIRDSDELTPSLLDRLLDDEPQRRHELPQSRGQLLRELKHSVRRDLENLLNTRWQCRSVPSELAELQVSLVNYGIPDFSGARLSTTAGREQLRSIVERSVGHFEPRLTKVRVTLLPPNDELDRRLRLRIDAMLRVEPHPEPVVFDSELKRATSTFEVTARDP
jgi:type VI secretion system protein ImpF